MATQGNLAAPTEPAPPEPGTEYEATEDGDFGRFLQYHIKPGYSAACKIRRMTFKLPYDELAHSGFLKYVDVDPANLWEGMYIPCLSVCVY